MFVAVLVLLQILPTTMYANNRYIEGYDQNVNPGNAPLVVVQLLDDECPEDFIKGLTLSLQARYVVERMDPELWEKVLSPDNEFRRQLIDQVVSTSLPESKSPEQVSAAVKVGDVAVKAALYDEAFVAKVQLCEGLVSDAIESFIRAEDATQFLDDIWASEDANVYHDLVSLPNVGDRLCDEASKVIYAFISNWAKLAVTLVKHKQFQGAVDAARKANRSKTWKEVCFACGDAEEFRLAQIFRLSIIVQVDELEEEHPNLINDPINVLVLRVDLTRIVDIIRKAGHLYEEDSDRLRESIDLHDNFDQIGLGQKVEKHELLEM
ncbi:hypothetical protein H6P81_007132 [Aristolochia fimbriata]|uniref:Uncharacterized protein n=1 Tax=Aristolochia fimbriata TaxID=158543 RepID=A0AAV7EZM1_ARIFI|nr:hypothetical protein H6P81_007132 [Aristolochia fimbriata]